MVAINNPEQLGFNGQDVCVIFKDGREISGHATMHASDELIDLRLADGRRYQFSLHDDNLREVTCVHDIDD